METPQPQGPPFEKKKPTTKAERRELQEAQRKAKEEKKQQQEASQPPKQAKPQGSQPKAAAQPPKEKPAAQPSKDKPAASSQQAKPSAPSPQVPKSSTQAAKPSAPKAQTKAVASGQTPKAPSAAKRVAKEFDDPKKAKDNKRQIIPLTLSKKQVLLFSHLPQYERPTQQLTQKLQGKVEGENSIHPAIFRLGMKYANGSISGSTARCLAMLKAFKTFVSDYRTPPEKVFHVDLEAKIRPVIQFLNDCRPKSLSMGNAINYFKIHIAFTSNMGESEAKEYLIDKLDEFIRERIEVADNVITNLAMSKIEDGDVILTHASSRVVTMTILRAHESGKKFRVVVVDSRPKNEGLSVFCQLVSRGVECSYIQINAVSYIMREVTKVFLGAYALLANGAVISRVGTALVAMMAQSHHKPVLVCCETYKFCERVLLDSICFNELGNADDLVHQGCSSLQSWKENDKLQLLNLLYDVTPMNFITLVISEVGMIPPTSVPVVLREYKKEPYQ